MKQLNDEQLFKLLEEAYHSKKLDEKNKTSIFRVSTSAIICNVMLIKFTLVEHSKNAESV